MKKWKPLTEAELKERCEREKWCCFKCWHHNRNCFSNLKLHEKSDGNILHCFKHDEVKEVAE